MATDSSGREIPNYSESDLLGGTSAAASGSSAAIDQLLKEMADGTKASEQIISAVRAAISSTEGLSGKLDTIESTLATQLAAARKALNEMKNAASSGKTVEGLLTKDDLNKAIDRLNKFESPRFKDLVDTITSKHTVYVRDTDLARITQSMATAIDGLRDAVDHLSSLSGGRSGGTRTRGSSGSRSGTTASSAASAASSGVSSADQMFVAENATAAASAAAQAGMDGLDSVRNMFVSTSGEIQEQMEGIGHANENFIDQLERSGNYLKDQLLDYVRTGKMSRANNKSLKENLDILRKSAAISSRYGKGDKAAKQNLENSIVMANTEHERDAAMQMYLRHLDEANKRTGNQSRTWGQIKTTIIEAGKAAAKWISEATKNTINANAVWGEALEDNFKFIKNAGELGYTLGTNLDKIRDFAFYQDIAQQTGQKRIKFEQQSLKMMKTGIKDQDRANKLTMVGLKLATDIGVEAEQTTEMIGKWSRLYKMSNGEASQMGRYIKEVAFQSGLAGEELMAAVRSTEKLTTMFRDLGYYSKETARNVLDIQAAAQKRGVDDVTSKIIEAASSADAFRQGGGFTNLVAVGGARKGLTGDQMFSGEIAEDKGLQKKVAAGLEEVLREQIGNFGGNANIKDLTEAIKSVPKENRAGLNAVINSLSQGEVKGAGQLASVVEAFNEGAMDFTDRMKAIADEEKQNLTKQERTALENRKNSMTFTESMRHLGKLDELAKSGGATSKTILDQVKADRADIVKSLEGMGVKNAGSMTEKQLLAALGKQAGVKGNMNTPEALRNAISEASAAQNRKEIDERAETNAFTGAEQKIIEIGQSIDQTLKDRLGGILNFLGPAGPMIAAFGGMAIQLASQFGQWVMMLRLNRAIDKNTAELARRGAHAGSIYTHDIHSERLLKTGFNRVERAIQRSGMGGGGDFGFDGPGGHSGGKNRRGGKQSKGGTSRTGRTRTRSRTRGGSGVGGKFAALMGLADVGLMGADMFGMMPEEMGEIVDIGSMGMEGIETVSELKNLSSAGKAANAVKGASSAANVAKGAGALGAASKGAGSLGAASKGAGLLSGASSAAGKALPFLPLLIGGATGFMEAEDAKAGLLKGQGVGGKLESTALGALTGSARKGSMFSSYLGVKEGSAGDEAMGVLGSAGAGALTGAAIGSVIPGVGTAIGAGVGGAVGGIAELYKVFTSDKSPLRDMVYDHFGSMEEILTQIPNPLNSVIGGFYAMSKASDIFGVKQEEVTLGMKASAGAAGMATGGLNALTFGIFKKQLGPDGTWTKGLAKFFNSGVDLMKSASSKAWEVIKGGATTFLKYGTPAGLLAPSLFKKTTKEVGKDTAAPTTKANATTAVAKATESQKPGEIVSGNKNKVAAIEPTPKVPGSDPSQNAIYQKLREERVAEAGEPGRAESKKELQAVQYNTHEMLASLKSIAGDMAKFVEIMNQTQPNMQNSTNEPGDPRSNRKPKGTSNFYPWNEHGYYANATKGPVSHSQPS